MRIHELTEKLGKSEIPEGTDLTLLYHLCDYHGYSYTIDQNALRVLRGSYISTTNNPNMNTVGGRNHYDFKLVLDGKALVRDYDSFSYVDHYYEVGNSGRRKMKQYKEFEIGLDTKEISPISDYLIGTILRFSLFSEKGIQWLFYEPRAFQGFMDAAKDEAPKAIMSLYHQMFEMRKPVWIEKQGNLMSQQEMAFVRDAYRIAKKGGSFKQGFMKLADKYPIVSHDNVPVTKTDVKRQFLAPRLVKMLNNYYVDRPYSKIKLDDIRKLLTKILTTIGIGNNAVSAIMGAIERNGLIHPSTEPVTWGSIIRDAMTGDIEKTIDHIEWAGEHDKSRREWYDKVPYTGAHYGTSFGRLRDY